MAQTEHKSTRVNAAYDRLKAELRENRLPSGYMAPETDVAERLGMSRTPVREALIRLEAEGLIELIPRRGMRVLPLKPADMAEIYDLLAALEPEAAYRLADMKPDAATLEPLQHAVTQMEAALGARDLEAWARADDRFHTELLDLAGNQRLRAFVTTLYDQAHRARMVTLRLRAFPEQSTREHREIYTHIAAGRPDQAHSAFRHHRKRTREELVTILHGLEFAVL